ncbi:MAG: STAS domain-containing protein [Streptosporangiaceae bacterium]
MNEAPGLTLSASEQDGYCLAVVGGEIDIATAGALQAFLVRCLGATASTGGLVIDLSAVTFMDARGVSALLRARGLARTCNVPMLLAAPSPCVIWLLRLTRLSRHFPVSEDPRPPGESRVAGRALVASLVPLAD